MTDHESRPANVHDGLCEALVPGLLGRSMTPCRCDERRERPAIDDRLLQMKAKRVRQATEALATVKRTYLSYVLQHASRTCESEGTFSVCGQPADGLLLISCGHFVSLCGEHLTNAYKSARSATETTCTQTVPDLHARPVAGVTVSWEPLA